ncbi:putative diphthamide synthesis protein-domain-containing protein [Lineolata rhizophorae]|uniref:Putative diphthamide synthesis protein-domain-containing protein n=1 Tax=Lineolata rhizophorae TaxID=578093 RepID=A0A6A6NN25_9PEZI|nr:putative diphthamide synthesis protein-domain-containing protein [Lineolata rhizophorae]
MAAPELGQAPVLSTPETHMFEDPTLPVDVSKLARLSDEQVYATYEVERTVREVCNGQWKRIALQFPDHMLVDAPRVYEMLGRGFQNVRKKQKIESENENGTAKETQQKNDPKEELFILADTSYGACCVDEVAAEHVDADVVVHYGRSCLSPTARLPVIYVFTERPLSLDNVLASFKDTFKNTGQKVILMADIPYCTHIPALAKRLADEGYMNIFSTSVIHNPSSPLPNRTVPSQVNESMEKLNEYQLFHISDPPTALLLTLSSRVSSIYIYPTTETPSSSISSATPPKALLTSTTRTLRRRYALLTSLTTCPIFGILINTLSWPTLPRSADGSSSDAGRAAWSTRAATSGSRSSRRSN